MAFRSRSKEIINVLFGKMKNFRKILLGLFLSLQIGANYAQDTAAVLFIGNSYTYFNNMPGLLTDIAASFGDHVVHASQTPGGMTFAGHAGNTATYSAMNNADWDYVVLQAQSQEPSFPYGQVTDQTLPYAVQLADSAQAISTCSQALFFMTWGRQNGDPQWDSINTFDKMNARLRLAYLRFANASNASVAPVGVAWKYIRENHPNINLYSGDGSHPSYSGSYLAACTFYASVFHSSPVGSSFTGSLTADEALALQQAASLCVLDSLETWGLKHHDSLASAAFSFTLDNLNFTAEFQEITEYVDSLLWDFGDGNTSTGSNPSHVYLEPGEYTVQLTGYSPCTTVVASQILNLEIPFGNINDPLNHNSEYLLKRMSTDTYELETSNENRIENLKLIDPMGRTLKVNTLSQDPSSIRFQSENKGPMLLTFTINGQKNVVRIHR